ncbi:RDD family protein [Amycolatopsis kentuckyensis]|uniref:RDD family protein n=1 Tax=Amycolatopsis kentuckyensis TaxID=218823 RepID=UPI000A3D5B77|nr:RDD family protein [Amycolatopsis kentuckyensis]
MTDPYGQQSFGQQPGGQPQFGQPQPGQAPYGQPAPYGQQAPFGQPAPFGQQGTPFGPPRNYASWGQRALGWLIDVGPILVLYVLLTPLFFVFGNVGSLWVLVGVLGWLGQIAWTVYNRWITQGNTGQSMGKRYAKIKLVREDTGQPIGPGMAFVRDLAHAVDSAICYVGWLWPLWDDKSQTLSDKIVGTVVVNADDAAAPFGQQGQAFAGGYPPPGQQPGQPGQFGQPPSGGFPQQPASGGFPQQPPSGGFEQQPAPGGFGQPQPGGFGQPPSGGLAQPPQPGGFGQQPGQPLAPPPGGGAFDEQAERTQMLRPGAGSSFDEQAERTQMLRPETQGEPEATQKIQPGQFGQPPNEQR